jgi:hypothetical protein
MRGPMRTYSLEGSRDAAIGRKRGKREWRAEQRPPPPRFNDPDEPLPPGTAAHEGRYGPKRSTNKRQLESHGAVLSHDVDSSWAPGLTA